MVVENVEMISLSVSHILVCSRVTEPNLTDHYGRHSLTCIQYVHIIVDHIQGSWPICMDVYVENYAWKSEPGFFQSLALIFVS